MLARGWPSLSKYLGRESLDCPQTPRKIRYFVRPRKHFKPRAEFDTECRAKDQARRVYFVRKSRFQIKTVSLSSPGEKE